MRRLFKFSVLTAILMITLTSCENGNGGSDPNNPDNPAAVMENVALSGTIRDTNGNPMSDVRITTGSLNATTGSDGTFSFDKAGTVDGRVIIQFEKNGYFTLTRSCEKEDNCYVEAMLYPKGNSNISLQATFDASTAKTLQIGGVKIDFPASSVVSADGKAYSGNVHADVLYLAPDNANFSRLMPGGDLTCRLSNNDEQMFHPYGITNVMLTDDSGNLLQIKEDAGVEISFPILSAMTANAPATLTFWSFDEARGVWTEDGEFTKQGNVYKGAVKHFCDKAVGDSYKDYTLKVRVLVCDQPKAGVNVCVYGHDGWWGWDYFYMTNSDGYCSIHLLENDDFTIKATYNGETKTVDAPKIDARLQIVLFNFDCPPDELAEKAALKIMYHDSAMGDVTEYLSWDNNGVRWRSDRNSNNYESLSVDIKDHIKNINITYECYGGGCEKEDPTEWVEWSLKGENGEQLMWWAENWFWYADKDMPYGWTRRAKDETVLGKSCSVWENSNHVVYKWKRIKMLEVNQGVEVHKVLAITEEVPESAFTKTLDVSWIH